MVLPSWGIFETCLKASAKVGSGHVFVLCNCPTDRGFLAAARNDMGGRVVTFGTRLKR